MKIKIEFNKIEKKVIANAFGCSLKHDYKELGKGSYGYYSYDPEGTVEFDLDSAFVAETVISLKTIVRILIGAIESFFGTIKDTVKPWSEDSKVQQFDSDGDEVVGIYDTKSDNHKPVDFVKVRLLEVVGPDPTKLEEGREFVMIEGEGNQMVYAYVIKENSNE